MISIKRLRQSASKTVVTTWRQRAGEKRATSDASNIIIPSSGKWRFCIPETSSDKQMCCESDPRKKLEDPQSREQHAQRCSAVKLTRFCLPAARKCASYCLIVFVSAAPLFGFKGSNASLPVFQSCFCAFCKTSASNSGAGLCMVLPQKENRMFPKVGQPMNIESEDSKSEGKA